MADRHRRRLERQFRALSRASPALESVIAVINSRRGILVRLPLGLLLLLGGLMWFLPFLGLWMIPLGLLLLAIDLPALRPAVTAVIIRLRRRWSSWRRRGGRPPAGSGT
jgi:hypothetical protein